MWRLCCRWCRAVSYTHLDVYKRQPQKQPAFRIKWREKFWQLHQSDELLDLFHLSGPAGGDADEGVAVVELLPEAELCLAFQMCIRDSPKGGLEMKENAPKKIRFQTLRTLWAPLAIGVVTVAALAVVVGMVWKDCLLYTSRCV